LGAPSGGFHDAAEDNEESCRRAPPSRLGPENFRERFQAHLVNNFDRLRPTPLALPPDTKVEQIACGARHSLLLTDQGHLYGVGDNSSGQLFQSRKGAGT